MRQHRPALVIADGPLGGGPALLWVVMITSAANRGWPGDVPITSYQDTGLPVASIVRTERVASIEAAYADRIGRPDARTRAAVQRKLERHLGLG